MDILIFSMCKKRLAFTRNQYWKRQKFLEDAIDFVKVDFITLRQFLCLHKLLRFFP